ncbi:MAG: COX15/CtaA family protein [Pseudanabaenaceae cyanobacterium]
MQIGSKGKWVLSPRAMGYGWLGLAGITWLLMALGSATRVMDAGLACPDWPLCFGSVIPTAQMDLQVFLEWFHRVVASLVGLYTICLAGWAWWQRRLAWAGVGAVVLVLAQGILGGLTVTEFLKFEIVTAHLGTGLLFFSYVLGFALILLDPQPRYGYTWRVAIGVVAVLLVYGQSLLGGLVASQWALHQCLDSQTLCAVIANHLWGIIPASVGVMATAIAGWGKWRKLTYIILTLWLLQLWVGYTTYRLQLSLPLLTVMHQAIGALLLGSLVVFTILSARQPTTP